MTPALALPTTFFAALLIAAPAMAELECSGGGYAADALVVPTDEIGDITSSTQYAWDGGNGLETVCNLLTEGADFFATWSLFSGEVDTSYPGICVSLTGTDGTEWYSCQTPDAVAAAFAAAPQTEAGVLRFADWSDTAPVLQ